MGNNITGGLFKIVGFVLLSIVITVFLMRFSATIFPPVQKPSAAYDCDDETLDMYYYFKKLGIESQPIVGNLEMTGETYMESNHVWLLVKSGDKEIAYDWGAPCFDRQHYEGYAISLDYLLYAVAQDKEGRDSLPLADY